VNPYSTSGPRGCQEIKHLLLLVPLYEKDSSLCSRTSKPTLARTRLKVPDFAFLSWIMIFEKSVPAGITFSHAASFPVIPPGQMNSLKRGAIGAR